MDRVLRARGLADGALAQSFLYPRLSGLHDPSSLHSLDLAAQRVLEALASGRTIAIYGDYDVDGVTAASILVHTLRAIFPAIPHERIQTYIPHRLDEGYGLNSEALQDLHTRGVSLVVTVDCGVSALAEARRSRELGLELVITDHHNLPGDAGGLPDAAAIVHPRHPLGSYPFGELCGAGVAYKLAWRLCTLHHGSPKLPSTLRTLLVDLLAFAALGVIADVVPLLDENRVIARHGLERIKHSPFVGLRALVKASGLDGESIGSSEVGFRLAPRLNAAGRMGHANDALELFLTGDAARAQHLAEHLTRQNEERRKVEKRITDQACEMAESLGMTSADRRAIVLAHEDWHAGVVGIACSRLVDRYHRPTILMQRVGDSCHGSGRSIDGFSLHAGLERCAEHLDKFGGHDMAAGLHVSEVKLPEFTRAFTDVANELIDEQMLRPVLEIDADARAEELSLEQVRALLSMAPFGRANPEPRIRLTGVCLADRPRPMGAHARHLSFNLRDGADAGKGAHGVRDARGASGVKSQAGRSLLRVVAWDWARVLDQAGDPLRAGTQVHAVVKPRISTWSSAGQGTGAGRVECELCDLALVT